MRLCKVIEWFEIGPQICILNVYFRFEYIFHSHLFALYFFPRVILYNFFLLLLIYGGLGFWGWGLILGFWGWGFQLMGFGACGVGLSGFFGLGSLYKHKRITLGKKMVPYSHIEHRDGFCRKTQ